MKTLASCAALVAALALTGCGGGSDAPDLNAEQTKLVQDMHKRGTASEKDLTCLVGKIKDNPEAIDSAQSDTDLSEQTGSAGEAIAAAWADCTGKTFNESFGYDPS